VEVFADLGPIGEISPPIRIGLRYKKIIDLYLIGQTMSDKVFGTFTNFVTFVQ